MSLKKCLMVILIFSVMAVVPAQAKQTIDGVELRTPKKMTFLFTPVVIPDLISAKFSYEYRLNKYLSLVVPLEGKWMDYHMVGSWFKYDLGKIYSPENSMKVGYDINISHVKALTGVGIKFFPMADGHESALFLKTTLLMGYTQSYLYNQKELFQSYLLAPSASLGYTWVLARTLKFGWELGTDLNLHQRAFKNLPRLYISGFAPFLQCNVGFSI